MSEFTTLEADGKFTLFVNSEYPPDKEIPLDHYRYRKNDGKYSFSRLYLVGYLQGGEIMHFLHTWYDVSVKPHCEAALVQQIDAQKGAKALLT